MSEHVEFLGTGEDENAGQVCIKGPINDLTLCGYAMDGDSKTAGDFVETEQKINCQQCIQIINFCKSIKKSEYSS